ncbi:FecCD family ABC transporter permease [Schaalia vaccimaxillae]|uniref:FecCD family ABC transporter permease n=1 Tax=Schaalia vaccimaxillae TaxID=183916 RepID=UPI0003B56EBA|nr:iron ABC transporter permease [Schaalia vaccimaxillae]
MAAGEPPSTRIENVEGGFAAPTGVLPRQPKRRGQGQVGAVALLLLVLASALASLAFGARTVSVGELLEGLRATGSSIGALAVQERIPRTAICLTCGLALGISGALMQSITRNPVADPGILGINTGASLAVVIGIAFFSASGLFTFLWLALIGGILTAIFVESIGSAGPGGQTPIKLALAGVATTAALSSVVSAIMLPRAQSLDAFRFWQVGSLGRGTWESLGTIGPFVLVGVMLAMLVARPLDSLALGDEAAVGLGVNVPLVKGIAALAGVLLCATVTAIAGPIGFVGLMVPHAVRMLVGPGHVWLLVLSGLGGALLLTVADVLGRVLIAPSEIPVGVITAFVGAPMLIAIARGAKVRSL